MTSPSDLGPNEFEAPPGRPSSFDEWLLAFKEQASFFTGLKLDVGIPRWRLADVLPVLFKRALDLHQTTFAMGESIAHLHLLWHDGRLSRQMDDDGIYRFATRVGLQSANLVELTDAA